MEGVKDHDGVRFNTIQYNTLSSPDITMTIEEEDELLRDDYDSDDDYHGNQLNDTNRNVCTLTPPFMPVTNQLPKNINENINRNNIMSFDDDSHKQQNVSVSELRFKTIAAQNLLNRNDRIVSNETIPKVNCFSLYDAIAEPIAEVEAGVDNDYMQRMENQKKKCQEIRKWKEERRYDAADDRINQVRINVQKLSKNRGRMRHNLMQSRRVPPQWKQTYGNIRQPYSNTQRSYGHVPRPNVFTRLSRDTVSDLNPQITTVDRDYTFRKVPAQPKPKRYFSTQFNPQNSQVNHYSSNAFIPEQFETPYDNSIYEDTPLINQKKTVLVKGLAPLTNEYSINAISQTIGPIVSCCIVLSNGERMAKTEFVSFRDANAFKNKFNNFTLDGCTIHTFFV